MQREAFLRRVQAALSDRPVARAPEPYAPPPPPQRGELVASLMRELEAVGGHARRVDSVALARRAVVEILQNAGVTSVLRGNTPPLRDLELDAPLASAGIELAVADLEESSRSDLRTSAFTVDAGITSVDYGVAETGTLAMLAGPGQGRAVSLLPPLHVAVLDAADIVQELAALFQGVRDALPSALTFITGPSRTGDIEQTLTVGVHGPRELHLVVIDRA